MNEEVWKDLPHYEGKYIISNRGRIVELCRKRLVKTLRNKDNFEIASLITLSGKRQTELVDRLVALAFVDNPDRLPRVGHINSINNDNRVENLYWKEK